VSDVTRIDLVAERERQGFPTAESFASHLGISPQVVDTAEQGGLPSAPHRFLIAGALGFKSTDVWPDDTDGPVAA
jgi:lambda repressor-like predicted transcriptional regulator